MTVKARTRTEAAYLLSERRKDEMLKECLQAFVAIESSEASRNFLILRDRMALSAPYTAQLCLARYMAQVLRNFDREDK